MLHSLSRSTHNRIEPYSQAPTTAAIKPPTQSTETTDLVALSKTALKQHATRSASALIEEIIQSHQQHDLMNTLFHSRLEPIKVGDLLSLPETLSG
ncbi:hypothetical protein ACQZV8_10550 [Magnetococcales bacterium HHB-1]